MNKDDTNTTEWFFPRSVPATLISPGHPDKSSYEIPHEQQQLL